MGEFDQVAAALEASPEARREEIALSDAQIADLQARLADPGPIATDEQVEAFFARFKACVRSSGRS